MSRLRIATYFPIYCGGRGHSHTCLSICEHLRSGDVEVVMYVPAASGEGRRDFTREAVPGYLAGILYRVDRAGRLASALLGRNFEQGLRRADLAYLWAGAPGRLYESARRASVPVVAERINCHRLTAIRVLDDAYLRAGLRPTHGITSAEAEEETRRLGLADRIFAPSPLVARSLLDAGIPAEKVIRTSYGWSPKRLAPPALSERPARSPSFAFVGEVGIRKGAHLLLEYWKDAGIRGRLALYGRVTDELRAVARPHLAREDVQVTGHVTDISAAYRASDVLAFPTLEEGSPLVVYEAMAHGLAIVTTPMGAGDVVRDGREGIVLDAFDREAWVATLRRLAADPDLRVRLGARAAERARSFTWERVGDRRRAALLAHFGARGADPRAGAPGVDVPGERSGDA